MSSRILPLFLALFLLAAASGIAAAADCEGDGGAQVSVELFVPGASLCNGGMVDLPVLVTNTSSDIARIALVCRVNGEIIEEQVFETVWPGQTRQGLLWFHCEEPGDLLVECVATASLVRRPACTTEERAEVVVSCESACVDIEDLPADFTAVPGETTRVPVTVMSCATGPQIVFLTCEDAGGRELATTELDLDPGESIVVEAAAFFPEPGTYLVTCRMRAELTGEFPCPVADTVTVAVTVFDTEFDVDAPDVAGCAGLPLILPVSITNRSSGPLDVEVGYTVGGAQQPAVGGTDIAPDETRVVELPLPVAETGAVTVEYQVTAWPSGSPSATTQETGSATATFRSACAAVSVPDTTGCVGTALQLPVTVTNCGPDPIAADLTVQVTGFGDQLWMLPAVPPGESRDLLVDLAADVPTTLEIQGEVSARLLDLEECVTLASFTTSVAFADCDTLIDTVRDDEMTLSIYPNPIRSSSNSIECVVPEGEDGDLTRLRVYDVQGRMVREIAEEAWAPGRYEVAWDLRDSGGTPVPAGLYFFRLTVGTRERVERLIVTR